MRIAIMQPGYLPWLGFFELMHNCDLFVLFDDVQYTKKDWRSRNRIRTKNGWMWLSVPVMTKGKQFQLINEAKINNSFAWRNKHFKAVEINYRKSRYFGEYFPHFKKILSFDWEYLVELDLELIKWLSAEIGIHKGIIKSSSLKTEGCREDKIIAVCKVLKADELYDSMAAASFLDVQKFQAKGIRLFFQNYTHPVYIQVYSPFTPFMSTLDLLFNCGPQSNEILLGAANGQENKL
jgi:hypothetical protein